MRRCLSPATRAIKVSGKQFANGRISGNNQNMSKQPPSEDQPTAMRIHAWVTCEHAESSMTRKTAPKYWRPTRIRCNSVMRADASPKPALLRRLEADTAEVDAERARLDDLVENRSRLSPKRPPPAKSSPPWFGIFNFLLILALAGTAAYFWRSNKSLTPLPLTMAAQQSAWPICSCSCRLEQASSKRLQSSLSPLESSIDSLNSEVDELGLGQQSLRESGEKLYQLFGRDRNAWQLAEVEYLMRVAQHKLILQDDFAGAAITLQAASDRIGLTGDPGLLPVRVIISEEIADLKTRRRADLVGMSLMLAQLGRRVRGLQPGFALRVEQSSELPAGETSP